MNAQHKRPGWNWAHLGLLIGLAAWMATAQMAGWPLAATALLATFGILAWLGWAEWYRPHRREWVPTHDDLKRDGVWFLAAALVDTGAKWLVRGVALWLATVLPLPEVAHGLPLWLAVPLAVVVGEFGMYWMHRWEHAGGWLWRVHALHHAPRAVNLTNNVTVHPINVLIVDVVRVLPLLLLGFPPEAVVYAGMFAQAQSFATHANTPGTMGWLNYLIGTAELHRRHHSDRVDEALNFGTAVPLWDQLFGTFRYRATAEPREVGLAQPAGYPSLDDLRGWWLYPFKRAQTAASSRPALDNPGFTPEEIPCSSTSTRTPATRS